MLSRIKSLLQFDVDDIKIELQKSQAIKRAARKNKPLVSYIGWTGHNNLGDEILFKAHEELFPRLSFVPFRKYTRSDLRAKIHGKPLYIAGFLGGGTLINQSPAWLHKIACLKSKSLPIYCFGTGVTENEFRMDFEKTSIEDWIPVLREFEFVGIRGPRSLKLLQKAGLTKAQQIGDTALSLAPATAKPLKHNKVIGFNYGLVKENQIWGDSDVYTENVIKSIKAMIAQGYEVRLLPVWEQDLKSNAELLRRVSDPHCTMRTCFSTLEDYTKELDECSLFIGQKLHATIMACMERIPSIMIEYQPKCRDFMASMDMEQYILKTSECTPTSLLAMLKKLEEDSDTVFAKLDMKVRYYRTLQHKLAKEIENKLLSLA